jgi:hypoxanthine phosphoribosyltransferase
MMLDDIEDILVTEEQIRARVRELGAQIDADYGGTPGDLILIAVLRGAIVFLADLSRNISLPSVVEFMVVEKLKKGDENAEVKIIKDLDISITKRHVLVVEDIIDEGQTLQYVVDALRLRDPASLRIVTIFDKPQRRRSAIKPDYVGFTVPDRYVVGYGLDYHQRYRNLPVLGVLKAEVLDPA